MGRLATVAGEAYRELNRLYPNTPEFAERLVAFTRSFGQKDFKPLEESARVQLAMAEARPASESYRTAAGELQAELGDYKRAGQQWDQLPRTVRLRAPRSFPQSWRTARKTAARSGN